jgi:hypothetical protein
VHVSADPLRDDRLMLRAPSDRFRSGSASTLYRKHFLDLGGAGVRDLCLVGSDLLVLTGSSMRGEGTAQVRQWKNALRSQGERMLDKSALRPLLELPYREKKGRPEGIAIVGRAGDRIRLLVIYDSARKNRRLSRARCGRRFSTWQ